jgi:hypothetical protein
MGFGVSSVSAQIVGLTASEEVPLPVAMTDAPAMIDGVAIVKFYRVEAFLILASTTVVHRSGSLNGRGTVNEDCVSVVKRNCVVVSYFDVGVYVYGSVVDNWRIGTAAETRRLRRININGLRQSWRWGWGKQ